MDMFKDYKTYKQFQPQYQDWKSERDKQEAKRLAYIKKHPELMKEEDIRRGKTLLKAIDILDEYSQSSAENTELATEIISQQIISMISLVGSFLGFGALYLKPVQKRIQKAAKTNKAFEIIATLIPTLIGGTLASLAAFPIMAWAAKVETGASRKGRLEAMKTKLQNPANFAVLNEEQIKQIKDESSNIKLSKEEIETTSPKFSFKESINILKNFKKQEEIERKDREDFQKLIQDEENQTNLKLSNEALEKAKRDQQILTKLVEKIDIASQDYAENVEFATNSLAILSPLFGGAIGWLSSKVNKLLKVKPDNLPAKIAPWAIGLIGTVALASSATAIQKQASRVGRFNVRQELAQNPEQLIYVDDEKVNAEIDDNIDIKIKKRPNIFKFIINAFKDNQKYRKYQKGEGLEDKKFNKALEKIELSEEQLQEAKALQRNTFKTFNKVDEMSQKYSENVEAVGESLKQPLGLICSTIGMLFGFKYVTKVPNITKNATKLQKIEAMMKPLLKYIGTMLISSLPVIVFDFYITREQKTASRVADMKAITDLSDVKNFAGYPTHMNENKFSDKIDSKKFLG